MSANSRRSRKWVYGSNTVISTVIFFAILAVVVLIAERHPWRVDLTESGSFSLSGQTRNILEALDQAIKIKCFYSTAAPDQMQAKNKTRDLLDTYSYYSNKISYDFIDPDLQPEVAQRYGVQAFGTVVLEGYDKKQTIQTVDEESITNALLKLSSKEQKKIYFLTGHGEHTFKESDKESYAIAKTAMEKIYYAVAEFNLLQQADVPADAAAVVIAGPKKPIPDAEQQVLKAYLARGGNIMLMIDPLVETGLDDFLRGYGIAVTRDVIVDRLSRLFGGSERMPVVVEYGEHKITDSFNLPTFYPNARSVVPFPKSPEGVHVMILASTSENAWAEHNIDMLDQGKAVFDKGEDMAGPVPIVVLATMDAQAKKPEGGAPEQNAAKGGTLVVAGNSEFVSNPYFSFYGNGDFFLNTISFLADQRNLITVGGRPQTNKPMLLTRAQASAVFWVVLILVPLAVLVSGLAVYRVRRAQR
jgi:ABC-type uncharacterized transport system involved in gliding motility auxiliary subunit